MADTYGQSVWRQFRKNKLAMGGLAVAIFFFALALLSPFIAGRLPFYWIDQGGNFSFPFWREFFAPSESRERLLDASFNYLLLLLLFSFALIKITDFFGRRKERQTEKFSRKFFTRSQLWWLGALLLLLPFIFTSRRNQPFDYRSAKAEKMGRGVFPIVPYDAYEQSVFRPKMPPSWSGDGAMKSSDPREISASHDGDKFSPLGTDEVGRDVLARLLCGARVSLTVGFISVSIATLIGIIVGSLAGFYGGWIDIFISRVIEIIVCFPSFFLILTVIAFLDQRSIINIMLIIGLTGWTGAAMVIRGEIFKQRSLDYVAAARALGASDARLIFRHILPNALAPVLVGVSFGIAGAIAAESGLSFLGIGVAPPTATWGELLMEGRDSPLANWWLSFFPGFAIFLAMTAYNLIGEGMRDAMDPKLRG